MATLRTALVTSATAAATATTVSVVGAGESGDGIVMTATGDRGSSARGHCVVDATDGEQTVAIEQSVPFERRFEGSRIRCMLEASGRVAVEVAKDGNRSRTETSGGTIVIDVR